jgi:hypothetical protein
MVSVPQKSRKIKSLVTSIPVLSQKNKLDIQHCLLLLDVIRKGKEASTYLKPCFFFSSFGTTQKELFSTS